MSNLHLLMVDGDEHHPLLNDVPERAVRAGEVGPLPASLWDEGGDPNDLTLQRWGVFAPEGPRGERLLQIVQPLIAARREQQGDDVQIYRVPSRLSASQAVAWKKTVFRPQTRLDAKLPRYQLLLGDLHELPLCVQQIQGADGFVGRLAFSRDEDYAAYVHKVLAWERAPSRYPQGRGVFHTVHDQTAATQLGHHALMKPALTLARAEMELGQINADDMVEAGDPEGPSPDAFLEAARVERPAVLFSLSHGEGPPRSGFRSAEQQRRLQGAMSFGQQGRIRGEDLAGRSFVPGGAWFMCACFGAGSPAESSYHHLLEELASLGQFQGRPQAVLAGIPQERPFVAAIPQQVLANPEGPLAFFGHMDLAWSYSFRDLDSGPTNRPGKFVGVLQSLLKRDRFGVSFRALYRYLDQTNTELTTRLSEAKRAHKEPDAVALAHLWMLRQDLEAYVLLGDPAARLALAERAVPARREPAKEVATRGKVALPLPVDELETAIGQLLAADLPPKEIAKSHRVSLQELRALKELYCAGGRAALGIEDE